MQGHLVVFESIESVYLYKVVLRQTQFYTDSTRVCSEGHSVSTPAHTSCLPAYNSTCLPHPNAI